MQRSTGTPMIIVLPTSFQINCIIDTNHMASLFCYDCVKFSCVNCEYKMNDKHKTHNVKSIWDLYATMIMMVCLNCNNVNEMHEVLEKNCNKQIRDDFIRNLEMVKASVKVTNLPKLLKEMSDLYDSILKEKIYFLLVNKLKDFEKKLSSIFNKPNERLKADKLISTITSIKDADKPPNINEIGNTKSLDKKFIQGTLKFVMTKKVEVVQSSKNIKERMKMFDKTKQQSNIKLISKQPIISVRKVEEKKPEQTIPTSAQPEQSQAVQIMITIPNTTSLLFFNSSNKTITEYTFDTSIPLMKSHHAYINIYPHLYISGGLLPHIPRLEVTGNLLPHIPQPSDSFIKITKTSSPDKPFIYDNLPHLSHPRSHHTMLYHPETNSIFALSGSCDNSCEVFSLDKNEWTLINELKYARENATTLIHNKHIYVFFGFDRKKRKYCTFIERLDISGNDFTEKEWEVVNSKLPLYLSRQMNMGYVLKEKSMMLFGGVNGMREYSHKVIEYDFDNDEGKEVKGLRLPIDCAYRQGGFIKGENCQCEKFYNFTTSFKIMECIQEKDVNIKINIY